MPTPKKSQQPKKTDPIEMLQQVQVQNEAKKERVVRMDTLVHDFDIQYLFDLNRDLRAFYLKIGDEHILELLDQMTGIMRELTEIITQVNAKKISLEQGQKEIQEKLVEVNEILQMMKNWESIGC